MEKFTEEAIMDEPTYHQDGKLWCHLTAKDIPTLHDIALKIGLRGEWFQNQPGRPHYDISSKTLRDKAAKLGVVRVKKKYLFEYLTYHYGSNKTS